MPLDRASLDADLTLLRAFLRELRAKGDTHGAIQAVADLATLIADRAGADRHDVERRLHAILEEEGLLPSPRGP